MRKKGMYMPSAALVGAVIAIVIFGLMFYFAETFDVMFNEQKYNSICSATIAIQSVHPGPDMLQIDSPIKLNCKRTVLSVDEKDVTVIRNNAPDKKISVYIDGKPVKTYSGLDQKTVNSIFADSLKRCWEKGLEGERQLFNVQGVIGAPTTCLICDEIHIEKPVTLGGETLTEYLAKNKVPGKEETYEEYLFTPKSVHLNNYPDVSSGDRECVKKLGIAEDPEIEQGVYATVLFRRSSQFYTGCQATYVMKGVDVARVCRYPAN